MNDQPPPPAKVQEATQEVAVVEILPLPQTNSTSLPSPTEEPTGPAPASNPAPAFVSEPVATVPDFKPHPARTVLDAQVVMARKGISAGPIDGLMGRQTRAAIRAFQQQYGLPVTGELDGYTRNALRVREPPLIGATIQAIDVALLRPVPDSWLGKSQAGRLGYESLLELMAERGRAYQSYIRRLNPGIDWAAASPGTTVQIPNVSPPRFVQRASYVRIFLERRALQAFDQQDRLMTHFPCSIASRVEKRPVGELQVSVIVDEPDYTFDPEIFTESEEGRRLGRRLRIPPGPNNPVGLVWIGLNLPGYGIHGTPEPENVGRTESHGCFRLANWNAQTLRDIAWVGMPVLVEP